MAEIRSGVLAFSPTPIRAVDVYGHWEDEQLGFPPAFTRLTFGVRSGRIDLSCEMRSDASSVTIEMECLGEHHLLVPDTETVRALRRVGLRCVGAKWQTALSADGDDARARAISLLTFLCEASFPVLTADEVARLELPWPRQVYDLLASEPLGFRQEGRCLVVLYPNLEVAIDRAGADALMQWSRRFRPDWQALPGR